MKKTQQLFAAVAVLISTSAFSAHAQTIEYSKSDKNVAEVSSAQIVALDATKNATWKDVMAGRVALLTMKGGDLDASWNMFKANNNSDWTSLFEEQSSRYNGFPKSYYTQGRTLTIGAEDYLVAYRQQPVIYETLSDNSSDIPREELLKKFAFTPSTMLLLSLLNLRTMGNMNDIKPFDTNTFAPVAAASTTEGRATLRRVSSTYLKQLGIGIMQYAQEYDEVYPPMQNMYLLKKAIYPYVQIEKVFRQPGTNAFYVPNMSLSKKHLSAFESPSTTAAIYEAQPDADGLRVVCFVDGHVKAVRADAWAKIKKDSGIK